MEHHLRRTYDGKATGGKLYSFINKMHAENLGCWKQRCCGNVYFFRIAAKKTKQARLWAEHYGVTLNLTPRQTIGHFLWRYRLRFGIPLGLLFMTGFLFYGSNIVMTIEIEGNETATKTEILAMLEEQGIHRGSWIPSIDFSLCEHILCSGIEELAWVGIRHTGNRLVVEVMEATPTPEMLQTRTPCNLVSQYDAQIVSFSIYTGQMMRLVGDGVRKGELLVSGVVMDETGHVAIRHAMGSIIGIYEQTQTFTCTYVQQMRTATGESTTRQYLDLFTWHIPLSGAENTYDAYVTSGNYHWFSMFGAELPIGIYRETDREYRTHILTYTPAEAEENLAEQKQRYEDNFLTETEILNETVAVQEADDGLTWTITYTLQGEIAAAEELYLQD